MPTYQYACTEPECGHAFEEFQSFTDDALTVCPRCEGRLRKVFNAVGVVFKGSGFYRTDSRTDSRAGSTSAEGASNGSTPSKDGSGGAKKDSSTQSSSPATSSSSTSVPSSTSSSPSAPAGAGAA